MSITTRLANKQDFLFLFELKKAAEYDAVKAHSLTRESRSLTLSAFWIHHHSARRAFCLYAEGGQSTLIKPAAITFS